jgi:hypothetical protein
MIALVCFVLAILTSPFKSKSRLEAENAAVCTENLIRVDGVMESPGGMIGLFCFAPAVLASPFKSKLRPDHVRPALEFICDRWDNEVVHHRRANEKMLVDDFGPSGSRMS